MLDNLEGIRLNPRYSTICGYAEADLDAGTVRPLRLDRVSTICGCAEADLDPVF